MFRCGAGASIESSRRGTPGLCSWPVIAHTFRSTRTPYGLSARRSTPRAAPKAGPAIVCVRCGASSAVARGRRSHRQAEWWVPAASSRRSRGQPDSQAPPDAAKRGRDTHPDRRGLGVGSAPDGDIWRWRHGGPCRGRQPRSAGCRADDNGAASDAVAARGRADPADRGRVRDRAVSAVAGADGRPARRDQPVRGARDPADRRRARPPNAHTPRNDHPRGLHSLVRGCARGGLHRRPESG